MNPRIPTFYSGLQVFLVYMLYFLGLLPFYPVPSDAFMVPLLTRSKVNLMGRLVSRRGCLARVLFVMVATLLRNSRALHQHLRRRGVLVVVWVLNEEEEFREAWDLFGEEIDGVMTDCPTKLANFINNY